MKYLLIFWLVLCALWFSAFLFFMPRRRGWERLALVALSLSIWPAFFFRNRERESKQFWQQKKARGC